MRERRIWLAYGPAAFVLFFLGLALLSQFTLSAYWSQRLPPGWSWTASFVGISTMPDPTTGQFPAQDTTAVYERSIRTLPALADAMAVKVEDSYRARDNNTGELMYEYTFQVVVDPKTGRHVADAYRNDYFVFPRQVAKQTYSLRNSYLEAIPVAYQGEERIEGLWVYTFAYQGRATYTKSDTGTADILGIRLEPGQEIRCADDQYVYKVWVEPITGETIKVDESCFAGSYAFDVASGRALYPVGRWGGFTAGDEVINRIAQIQEQRTRYLWATRYLPMLLWTGSLLSLVVAVIRWRVARSGQ